MTIRSATKTVHHIEDGPKEMLLVDANSAVARFPDEWSFTPWKKNGERPKPIIDIPVEWQDLKPSERVALAVRLGAERRGLTAAKADELIDAEVDKRAEEAAAEAEAEAEAAKRQPKEKPKPAVEIPVGWQDLKPTERISLAVKLGEKRVGLTAIKADEAIEAEVERRENEAERHTEAGEALTGQGTERTADE